MRFEKGNNYSEGRPEGSKNKTTLAKEERRVVFDEEAQKIFLNRIQKAKPEYILDQYLGKAPEKLDVAITITPIFGGRSVKNLEEVKKLEEVKQIENGDIQD